MCETDACCSAPQAAGQQAQADRPGADDPQASSLPSTNKAYDTRTPSGGPTVDDDDNENDPIECADEQEVIDSCGGSCCEDEAGSLIIKGNPSKSTENQENEGCPEKCCVEEQCSDNDQHRVIDGGDNGGCDAAGPVKRSDGSQEGQSGISDGFETFPPMPTFPPYKTCCANASKSKNPSSSKCRCCNSDPDIALSTQPPKHGGSSLRSISVCPCCVSTMLKQSMESQYAFPLLSSPLLSSPLLSSPLLSSPLLSSPLLSSPLLSPPLLHSIRPGTPILT
ncbi:uncharacterized protein I303_100259 [Kwoniella dejecticola CBS 10117]|uniref:Uncharacterized protein n=1 Tax=Kwoniella dejecticola CBS 10117 TaxID=1296121 RepID=A0AAJ8KHP0_9TREE